MPRVLWGNASVRRSFGVPQYTHIFTFENSVLSQIKNPHGPDAGFLFAAVSKGEGEGWEFAK